MIAPPGRLDPHRAREPTGNVRKFPAPDDPLDCEHSRIRYRRRTLPIRSGPIKMTRYGALRCRNLPCFAYLPPKSVFGQHLLDAFEVAAHLGQRAASLTA